MPAPAAPPGLKSSAHAEVASAGAWGLAGRLTVLLANFASTPLVIRLFGPARYGLWSLLIMTRNWASLADVGMETASTKFGAAAHAESDEVAESTIVWTATLLTATTTVCFAMAVALGAPFLMSHFLDVPKPLRATGIVALRILCGMVVLQALAGTINTPQTVRFRGKQIALITSGTNLLGSLGVPIILAVVAPNVQIAATLLLAASAIGLIATFFVAAHLQPALLRPCLSSRTFRSLLSYGGVLGIAGLAMIPMNNVASFFLGHNHSSTVVGYYSVAFTVATTVMVIPEQLAGPWGPLMPGLVRLEAERLYEEHRALYVRALQALFLIMAPATVIIAFLAQPFLRLWAGPMYGLHSTPPLLVLLPGVLVYSLSWVPYSYLLATGRTKAVAYAPVVLLLPYLAAAWILTSHFGAVGAAVATSAMYIAQAIIWFTMVWRQTKLPFLPFSERRWRSLAALALLALVLWVLAVAVHNSAERFCFDAVAIVGYFPVLWWAVLNLQERRGLQQLVLQMISRPRGARPPLHSRRRPRTADGRP